MNYYSHPDYVGWRGNLARAHRAWCAAMLRDRRDQARRRRDFAERMKETAK